MVHPTVRLAMTAWISISKHLLICPRLQYHIYLFERILLCCKDINPNKQKSRLVGGSKDKPNTSKGKPRLVLKGRIYMANVTDIVWLQKPGKPKFISSANPLMLTRIC